MGAHLNPWRAVLLFIFGSSHADIEENIAAFASYFWSVAGLRGLFS
jgi:hypothetical protein